MAHHPPPTLLIWVLADARKPTPSHIVSRIRVTIPQWGSTFYVNTGKKQPQALPFLHVSLTAAWQGMQYKCQIFVVFHFGTQLCTVPVYCNSYRVLSKRMHRYWQGRNESQCRDPIINTLCSYRQCFQISITTWCDPMPFLINFVLLGSAVSSDTTHFVRIQQQNLATASSKFLESTAQSLTLFANERVPLSPANNLLHSSWNYCAP